MLFRSFVAVGIAAGIASVFANRSLGGLPIPITLASGTCSGLALQTTFTLLGRPLEISYNQQAGIAPWGGSSGRIVIDAPLGLVLLLMMVAVAAAVIGLTGAWPARGTGAWLRLLAGAASAAATTIVLNGILPTRNLAPEFTFDSLPLAALALAAPVLLLMSGLVALPACKHWYERR